MGPAIRRPRYSQPSQWQPAGLRTRALALAALVSGVNLPRGGGNSPDRCRGGDAGLPGALLADWIVLACATGADAALANVRTSLVEPFAVLRIIAALWAGRRDGDV